MKKDLRASVYADQINKIPKLPNEKQVLLFKQWREQGSESARLALYNANLHIAVAMAKKCCKRPEELDDLISEGAIGINKALQKYKPELGDFGAYAWQWVRAKIYQYVMKNWRICAGGRPFYNSNFFRLFRSYAKACCLSVDTEERVRLVAKDFDISTEEAKEWLHVLLTNDLSLSYGIDFDDGGTSDSWQDSLPDPEVLEEKILNKDEAKALSDGLKKAIEKLPPRHQIVMRSFATRDTRQVDIAKELGITRQRVEQIQRLSMTRIKKSMAAAA